MFVEEWPPCWCTKVLHQDGVYIPNYIKLTIFELPFNKIRGIRSKIELTNSNQFYPSLEKKKSWLLFRGDLWSRDLLVENHLRFMKTIASENEHLLHQLHSRWEKILLQETSDVLDQHLTAAKPTGVHLDSNTKHITRGSTPCSRPDRGNVMSVADIPWTLVITGLKQRPDSYW